MTEYQERLFKEIADRQRLVRGISIDGFVADKRRLFRSNKRLMKRRNSDVYSEMLTSLSDNMPETIVDYNLTRKLSDTKLVNNQEARDAILRARIEKEKYGNHNNIRTVGSVYKLRNSLNRYVTLIGRQNEAFEDNERLMSLLEIENQSFSGIVNEFRELAINFLDEPYTCSALSKSNHPRSMMPEELIKVAARLGRFPYQTDKIRRCNLDLLDRFIYPAPEHGFATPEDSWTLFRSNYMADRNMNFALLRERAGEYELHEIEHKDTNALSQIERINRNGTTGTKVLTLETAIKMFEDSTCTPEDKVCCYSIESRDYEEKRKEFYKELLKQFGVVTSIKSLHEDQSLLFYRYELKPETQALEQNITRSLVNVKLRKIVSLADIVGGDDRSITEAYPYTMSVINGYKRQVFEEHMGALVSDISKVESAKGYIFIPTVLAPSNYPSIGVARAENGTNGTRIETAITVRGNNVSHMKVEDAIKRVFGSYSRAY